MINILPYAQKKMVSRIRVIRVLTVLVWALLIVVSAGGVLLLPTLFTINSRYALATAELSKLEQSGALASVADIKALQNRIQALSKKLAAPAIASGVDYIATVRTLAGPGITVSGFAFEQGSTPMLSITGTAATRTALQNFVATLQKEPSIASVDSPITNFVKSSNSDFKIELTLKP